ncbi:cytochrome b561 [Arboricoccus pini]|uniref:Cytochrome b561 n=1 Tax=Arboricoccus pini TaxID=1963835 RepID=A0A212R6L9_9PROT|nr:cytochrome b [Arboricoccus pini]SNB67728.1 cytochrome b561 [Arboricoccus pini]
MATMNTANGWGWPARLLHWGMALLIVAIWLLGRYMVSLPDSAMMAKFDDYQLHKSLGLTAFALGVVRLLWRTLNPAPAMPPHMPGWERLAAHASHALLYVLILGIPLSGYLMASSSTLGIPTIYFKIWHVPHLLGPNAAAETTFKWVHDQLGWLLVIVLGLHVAAALKHQVIDRDDILKRMLKG